MAKSISVATWLHTQKANRLAENTLLAYAKVVNKLNDFKPVNQIRKQDLQEFFGKFEGADSTRNLYVITIKKFFTDNGKPELVDWLKLSSVTETLRSEDILTRQDINKLITNTDKPLFQALIAVLFDSGGRINEVLTLRYKDFVDTVDGVIVTITTKKTSAGYRRILLPFATQYVRNLKVMTNSNPDELVFPITYDYVYAEFLRIAKKAGMTKPVSPHKFRHASATDDTKCGIPEAIIKKKHGWSKNSTMAARYQHLSDEDTNNAMKAKAGRVREPVALPEPIVQPEAVKLVSAADMLFTLQKENEELKKRLEVIENKNKEYWNRMANALASIRK